MSSYSKHTPQPLLNTQHTMAPYTAQDIWGGYYWLASIFKSVGVNHPLNHHSTPLPTPPHASVSHY